MISFVWYIDVECSLGEVIYDVINMRESKGYTNPEPCLDSLINNFGVSPWKEKRCWLEAEIAYEYKFGQLQSIQTENLKSRFCKDPW